MKYDFTNQRFPCARCGKSYLRKRHLQRHMRDECIGIPPRFTCDLCPSRFRRKYHMVRHLTSKHGIPPAVAQQATGSSSGANRRTGSGCDGSGCDSPIPENLSMRKEYFEHETKPSMVCMLGGGGGGGGGGGLAAATGVGSLTGAVVIKKPPASPPLPTTMPTYGLTGAITAISAAAAAAVVGSNEEGANLSLKQADVGSTAAAAGVATAVVAAADAGGDVVAAIKAEPVSPGKAAAMSNMMDDEWKMKLSLQLISNSLLKERLMNSMPFAYNNN